MPKNKLIEAHKQTKTAAQKNVFKLPSQCYGKLLIDNSIIIIKAGESGYYPIKSQPFIPKGQSVDDFINELNAEDGVTIQQRKAMEWGSQFGWGGSLASPERYDIKGQIIKTVTEAAVNAYKAHEKKKKGK